MKWKAGRPGKGSMLEAHNPSLYCPAKRPHSSSVPPPGGEVSQEKKLALWYNIITAFLFVCF